MIQALKQQTLFSDIDAEGLEKLSKIVKKVALKKGESLFKEKRIRAESIFFIRESGNLKGYC